MNDQTTTPEQSPAPDQTTIGGCQQDAGSAERLRLWMQARPKWMRPLIGLAIFILAVPLSPLILILVIGNFFWATIFAEEEPGGPY